MLLIAWRGLNMTSDVTFHHGIRGARVRIAHSHVQEEPAAWSTVHTHPMHGIYP
jgi:hypothetical protein